MAVLKSSEEGVGRDSWSAKHESESAIQSFLAGYSMAASAKAKAVSTVIVAEEVCEIRAP